MKELGLYIHIPFCKKKCDYCDFISYSDKINCIKEYVEALKNEIKHELNKIVNDKENYRVTTIYIGGGTPSFIDSKYIREILNNPAILVTAAFVFNTVIDYYLADANMIRNYYRRYKK